MEIKLRPFKYHISLSSKIEIRNDQDNKYEVKVNLYKNILVIFFQYAWIKINLKSIFIYPIHVMSRPRNN